MHGDTQAHAAGYGQEEGSHKTRLVLGIGEASFDQLVSVEPASASNLALPQLISSCVNK